MDPSEDVMPYAPLPETLTDVSPLTPAPRHKRADVSDAVDQAGQTVLGMLQQAAVVAKENFQHALDVAHKLSVQLRATEERVKELEAEVQHCDERAARAEQWLLRISKEIEQRFLDPNAGRSRQSPPRQGFPVGRGLEAAE
jgi:BMFP domain-containing protein YqiC